MQMIVGDGCGIHRQRLDPVAGIGARDDQHRLGLKSRRQFGNVAGEPDVAVLIISRGRPRAVIRPVQVAHHRHVMKRARGVLVLGAHKTAIQQEPPLPGIKRGDDPIACADLLAADQHMHFFLAQPARRLDRQITVDLGRWCCGHRHRISTDPRLDLCQDARFPTQPLHLPDPQRDQHSRTDQAKE